MPTIACVNANCFISCALQMILLLTMENTYVPIIVVLSRMWQSSVGEGYKECVLVAMLGLFYWSSLGFRHIKERENAWQRTKRVILTGRWQGGGSWLKVKMHFQVLTTLLSTSPLPLPQVHLQVPGTFFTVWEMKLWQCIVSSGFHDIEDLDEYPENCVGVK